jgi:hypothetical protein
MEQRDTSHPPHSLPRYLSEGSHREGSIIVSQKKSLYRPHPCHLPNRSPTSQPGLALLGAFHILGLGVPSLGRFLPRSQLTGKCTRVADLGDPICQPSGPVVDYF